MKTCPTCGREADVLVTNVQDGSQFCFGCAPPSFSRHGILTLEDLAFLRSVGVDPQIPDVLMRLIRPDKA